MAVKKSELYSSLWKSCDELRGGMDASQYKDRVEGNALRHGAVRPDARRRTTPKARRFSPTAIVPARATVFSGRLIAGATPMPRTTGLAPARCSPEPYSNKANGAALMASCRSPAPRSSPSVPVSTWPNSRRSTPRSSIHPDRAVGAPLPHNRVVVGESDRRHRERAADLFVGSSCS